MHLVGGCHVRHEDADGVERHDVGVHGAGLAQVIEPLPGVLSVVERLVLLEEGLRKRGKVGKRSGGIWQQTMQQTMAGQQTMQPRALSAERQPAQASAAASACPRLTCIRFR